MDPPEVDLPKDIGAPATRALVAAGYTRLAQFANVPLAELRQLHGVGPSALTRLQKALEQRNIVSADAAEHQELGVRTSIGLRDLSVLGGEFWMPVATHLTDLLSGRVHASIEKCAAGVMPRPGSVLQVADARADWRRTLSRALPNPHLRGVRVQLPT